MSQLKEANSSNVDKRDLVFYFLQVSNMSLLSRGQLSKARATAMHQYQGMLWCAETRMRGATGSSTHDSVITKLVQKCSSTGSELCGKWRLSL